MASELAIRITTDAQDAVSGMGAVGDAATRMGDEVERASRAADTAVSRIDSVGTAADGLDSKAGKATGALGALSSGFELVGAEKYAGGLQAAALATDFLSGAGQALTLVTEGTALVTAKATLANIAHGAAAKATAAGQWLLNAAMSANPIMLVVIAAAALVAGFVLLYRRSELVRSILTAVGNAGKAAIGWVVDAVGSLVGWFTDKVPAALDFLKDKVVDVFKLITTPHRKLIELVGELIGWVRDELPDAFGVLTDIGGNIVDFLVTPFKTVLGFIQDIIDAIKKIHLPDLPDLNPFRAATTTTGSAAELPTGAGSFGNAAVVHSPVVQVSGIVGDGDAVMAAIATGLDRYYRRFGVLPA